MDDSILEDQGRIMLRMARESIGEKLRIPSKAWGEDIDTDFLDNRHGLFVTLHKAGELRGCIGTIEPVKPLRQAICETALFAAFNDTRFSPLTPDEFPEVDIEVSLLSIPEPLEFTTPEELLAGLKAGIHGVIIKKEGTSATFLPQVWEQLPGAEDFLSRLCVKAGLFSSAWKDEGLTVYTYEIQCFSEIS